jgi:hypothetical protein
MNPEEAPAEPLKVVGNWQLIAGLLLLFIAIIL